MLQLTQGRTIQKKRVQSQLSRNMRSKTLTRLMMAMPAVVYLFIFAYIPMFGIIIAFKDYRIAQGLSLIHI